MGVYRVCGGIIFFVGLYPHCGDITDKYQKLLWIWNEIWKVKLRTVLIWLGYFFFNRIFTSHTNADYTCCSFCHVIAGVKVVTPPMTAQTLSACKYGGTNFAFIRISGWLSIVVNQWAECLGLNYKMVLYVWLEFIGH